MMVRVTPDSMENALASLNHLDEEVALIKANKPRGNFLKSKHTHHHFQEHWQPSLLSRDNYDTWRTKGQNIEQLCREKATRILDEHAPSPLPASIEAELESIVRRYIPDFHFGS
jgi:trimethylamine:corrinoid methyltransferase-like protein